MALDGAFKVKHYVYLLIWWLSMGYSLATNSSGLGILFTMIFFFISTFNAFKRMILVMLVVFIATAIFPPLAAILAALSTVFILLKISYLLENWRALAVGLYAYGVYLLVVILNGFFFNLVVVRIAAVFMDAQTVAYGSAAANIVSCLFAFALTVIFYKLLKWLCRNGYSMEKAFQVMGLTPLLLITIILPFLKIRIGDSEIFSGSFTDDVGSIDVDIDNKVDVGDVVGDVVESAVDAADIDVTNIADATNIDVTDIADALEDVTIDIVSSLNINAAEYSPAVEASFASAAAYGLFKLSGNKDFTIRREDGSTVTVNYVDDTNAIIKDSLGRELGTITVDKLKSRQIVKLSGKLAYTIDLRSGDIVSADGKVLGKLEDDGNGNKRLVGAEGEMLREFRSNGFIIDGNRHITGTATV